MTNLNLIEAARFYINRMIEDCGPSAKGLIMDKETVCDKTHFIPIDNFCLFIKGFNC